MRNYFVPFVLAIFCLMTGCTTQKDQSPDATAARALAQRVIPAQAGHFVFETLPADTCDYFTLRSEGRKVVIGGNNANSMAVGLNYYLKYYCHTNIGWFAWDKGALPKQLPAVAEPVRRDARVPERFFLNYCTYGYTMPWWTWKEWEHFIDWMALNGINLPLAITGQESVWYQVWTELGLTDEEVRNYFTGPAHLPWHRMLNIDRWGGPLPKSWLEGQEALQKQIVARERELNMKPVLPAFAGHVPPELQRVYPDAKIERMSDWAGFALEDYPWFLDPEDKLFPEIQKRFLEKEVALYGTDHVYGIDIFNEMIPRSWEPDYLAGVSKGVYESLAAADPEATWLQMTWLFYNERRYWFENAVFEKAKSGFAFPDELCAMMKQAQKRGYGDGLDLDGGVERLADFVEDAVRRAAHHLAVHLGHDEAVDVLHDVAERARHEPVAVEVDEREDALRVHEPRRAERARRRFWCGDAHFFAAALRSRMTLNITLG